MNALQYVFLGPLVGALSRAGTGWISDRFGGGRVTFWVFVGMIVSVLAVILALQAGSFAAFFMGFMALFFFTGVGNASTFQMIPVIMGREVPRLMPQLTAPSAPGRSPWNRRGSPPFSAIGAYGGFFIPKAYGSSITMTGSPIGALWLFLGFYVICLGITWLAYTRRGGLLHDIERGRAIPGALAQPAQ